MLRKQAKLKEILRGKVHIRKTKDVKIKKHDLRNNIEHI